MKAELIEHKGKGARSEVLPNRHALNTLMRAPGAAKSINDYSKAGATIVQNGADITEQGTK